MDERWLAGTVMAVVGISSLLGLGRALQLRKGLAGEAIIRLAYGGSCFGASDEHAKAHRIRGSGILALTSSSLTFRRYFGRGKLDIPLSSLTGIDETHTFKDKVSLSRLLVISYRNESGASAAAAFTNINCGAWSEAILQQRKSSFM